MRSWVFERKTSSTGPDYHDTPYDSLNTDASWEDYAPYTNVLWLWFLFDWLINRLEESSGGSAAVERFREETKELAARLCPDDKTASNYKDAADVANYAMRLGWIAIEDLYQDTEGNSTLEL